MKKSVLIVATLCLTSVGCVKHQEEFSIGPPPKAITFQTAKYRLSRATEEEIAGSKFTYDHFVTHAWSDASVAEGNVFMDHQRIEKNEDGTAWMPTVDYYWPTASTVDFISYYPENAADRNCPTVEREKLTYTGYDVSGDKTDINVATNDLMYAEKAVGYSGNIDRVNDDNGGMNDSGYSGVPTLFHHALAQLEIRLLVQQPAGETESHWEAVIDHAALTGYYTKGNLELTLNDPTAEHGIVGWTPIADNPEVGWTNDGNARSQAIVGTGAAHSTLTVSSTGTGTDYLTDNPGCRSLFKAFVLPPDPDRCAFLRSQIHVEQISRRHARNERSRPRHPAYSAQDRCGRLLGHEPADRLHHRHRPGQSRQTVVRSGRRGLGGGRERTVRRRLSDGPPLFRPPDRRQMG